MMARMTVPKCGARKKRSKYGSALCQRDCARLPDGTGHAPRCKPHLTGQQQLRFGFTTPGGPLAG